MLHVGLAVVVLEEAGDAVGVRRWGGVAERCAREEFVCEAGEEGAVVEVGGATVTWRVMLSLRVRQMRTMKG